MKGSDGAFTRILIVAGSALMAVACTAEQPLPEPRDRLDSSLVDAVNANRPAEVKDLLRRGANPNAVPARDHEGYAVLAIAASEGYLDVARALLAAGAHANPRGVDVLNGIRPLSAAAATNHRDIVSMLLDHGANVNARSGFRGTGPTALHWAARNGHVEPVILLLACGATIERADLRIAISEGRLEIATLLLDAGADPWWRFSNGATVLEEAQRSPTAVRAKMVATLRVFMGAQRVGQK